MLDVDHFKRVNDSWGHSVGDEVLKEVGHRIQSCLRKSDLVARIGGDEFVVLVQDVDSPCVGEGLARKVWEAMQPEIIVGAVRLQMTLSIGIAFCQSIATPDDVMQLADAELYKAKADGRNTYHMAAQGQ